MANTFKFGNGNWATKKETILAYNDENNNFKPLPFTFDRGSIATVVNSDGLIETVGIDEPRIDFLNNTKGHLLLEPQSTNTATYSNDFTQGDIFNQSAVPSLGSSVLTQNQEKAPDGTNNGWLLKDNNDGGTGIAGLNYFSTQVNSDDFNTISIFAKKALSNDFLILESAGYDVSATGRSYFNISNGSLGDISTTHTAKIEDYGNGWYRCSITFQTTTDLQGAIYVRLASSNGLVDITKDGTNGVYIFGLQCEADASQNYTTSYIPTSGSAVTRSAETCDGAGIDSIFSEESGGSIYFEIQGLADDGTSRTISLSHGGVTDEIYILYSGTSNRIAYFVRAAGGTIFGKNYSSPASGLDISQTENHKIAVRYQTGNSMWAIDGVPTNITTDLDSSFSFTNNITTLSFARGNGITPFYGKVKEIRVYNTALTDEELIALTTI